ncbi:MAG TPA: hypothetical protein K8W21_04415 [Enorma massiliensis]|uniref:hypothetical protein n=1 Tax=Enorma massiliensis TaxID=1472761 RepID=UPI001D92B586|nr:hypothetical protein [Enorma massiliensis]HJG62209.1 hypothetical protein [Enorma massiliensis]
MVSFDELSEMTDDELKRRFDDLAKNTIVGTAFYLDEINRRAASKINDSMLQCTKWMTCMTGVMLILTIANVIIAAVS